jgi:hypothetical protein
VRDSAWVNNQLHAIASCDRSNREKMFIVMQIVIYTSARVKCMQRFDKIYIATLYTYHQVLIKYIATLYHQVLIKYIATLFDKIYSDSLYHQVLIKYIATLYISSGSDKIYSDSLYHQVLIKYIASLYISSGFDKIYSDSLYIIRF